MKLFQQLNLQTRIILITFVMIVLVVVTGAIAIDRVILPAMEQDLQNEAWRIARGVLNQVQELPNLDDKGSLEARLSNIFQVGPKLLYVELLDADGKPVFWQGEEKYHGDADTTEILKKEEGDLSLRQLAAGGQIYEVLLRVTGETIHGSPTALRVGVNASSLRELSQRLLRVLFTVTFLIFGVSFFLIRWFSNMITRPVSQLLHMTHLLAKGQLEDVVDGIHKRPPCQQKCLDISTPGPDKTEELCPRCPLLSDMEDENKVLLRGVRPDPCHECDIYAHYGGDELSRLLFTFQCMAAGIRSYQEKLRLRYEFEERLLEACPDGIMANDRGGKIILYNKGAERLLGYEATEVLNQLSVEQIYPPKEAYAVKQALLSDDYGGPGILLDYTTQAIRKDGRTIPIRLSAALLHREAGGIAVVGYFHDLTELHQHMNALVEVNECLDGANKELERRNRHYMEMLSFVTHELKAPVANAFMSANALRQGIFSTLTPEQLPMVGAICRNLTQSMEMIRHYLDLSRIERGELPIQPRPSHLFAEVIKPVLNDLATMILDRGASVVVEVREDLEWNLDSDLFRGVFTNLVSNALKYGEERGRIRISAEVVGNLCRMQIWNTGPGIRAQDRDKLFRRFQRLQSSRSSSTQGTGLGLFITKNIVERHGGTIRMEGQEGEWINFIIELPQRIEH